MPASGTLKIGWGLEVVKQRTVLLTVITLINPKERVVCALRYEMREVGWMRRTDSCRICNAYTLYRYSYNKYNFKK